MAPAVLRFVGSTAVLMLAAVAANAAGNVVISQIYGAGGNSGATLQNDFVELFNRSDAAVDITGWSVQYASATGSGNFSQNSPVSLSGTLQPGQYYLVQFAGGANGAPLPVMPDVSSTTPNMAAGAGKVALVNTSTGLACNGSSTLCSTAQLAQIVDLVGYGNANFFEGSSAAPTLSATAAAIRAGAGCTDTDANGADFSATVPAPRNSATPLSPCGTPINQPIVPSCPANVAATVGVGTSVVLTASDADGFVSSASIVSTPISGITLVNVAPGSTLSATLDIAATTAVGGYNVQIAFENNDATPQTATCTVQISVAPAAAAVRIHDIQGGAHLSPLLGQTVSNVPGIVTSRRGNGFNLQEPDATVDSDPATSEGIFVFTSSAPTVNVGDSVLVAGTVAEFRAGGSDGLDNLTLTEIVNPTVSPVSTDNPLPAPVSLGYGGSLPAGWRSIPTSVIDDDASGSVETSGSFDAGTDGIDFYESLEGMRVRIVNPVAVGPTNSFGEIAVLANEGIGASLRTVRGGIVIHATDFNPERLILDDVLSATPQVDVNDKLSSVTAVVDYSFGNFKFYPTEPLTVTDGSPARETTALTAAYGRLTVAGFNVENLAATNSADKFARLATQIVTNLSAPDVIAVSEIQDNNGATNDGVVDASTTAATLIQAIQAAGGPVYQFRNINPVDDQDGGEPGGNIRVGFLFNPARVSFVDRAGGTPTAGVAAVSAAGSVQLSFSPGRIDPANAAFANSRKPLAGEFLFHGRRFFVIANHFNSKGGDDPLFGHPQPPVRSSEIQRHQQAAIVRNFVQSLLALDVDARIIVLGDLNDFEFSETLSILKSGSGLVNLIEKLPAEERYSYVYDGNSQVLDNLLISASLASFAAPQIDVVHTNAEYFDRATDHDPAVTRLTLGVPGDVDNDGDIDRLDVTTIVVARNTSTSNPNDARDLNEDGRIDALDARLATLACTRPRCAVNRASATPGMRKNGRVFHRDRS